MPKNVLAIGLDPAFADYSRLPNVTPELVSAYIKAQLDRVRAAGYQVTEWLVDPHKIDDVALAKDLQTQDLDCVMFGAGIREPQHLAAFEKLLNLVHEHQPNARICFNTNPADTLEAVRRWV